MQVERRSNEARSRETKQALLDAARALFIEFGYSGSSTPMIVERAGTTRGALYHHYKDKMAIFRAVLEREAEAVADAIAESEKGKSNLTATESLLGGAKAYLDAMKVDGRTRLLLVEGPAILGASAVAEIEARYARESLELGIAELMIEAELPPPTINALCELLSAMFDRAALSISEGGSAVDFREAIKSVLSGLSQAR